MSEASERINALCEADMDGALRMALVLAYISDDNDEVIWDDSPMDVANEVDYSYRMTLQFMTAVRQLHREELTELALSMSLCPIHLVDYAICFDDEDTECAQVRRIHPGHDT